MSDLITVYNDSNVKLPAMKISLGGNIKYPYDKIITFDEFSNDMNRRKENSTMIKLYE